MFQNDEDYEVKEWDGVPISNSRKEEYIRDMVRNPGVKQYMSGDTLVSTFDDGHFYICKIEKVVIHLPTKEECYK